jgi:hypothetical protein
VVGRWMEKARCGAEPGGGGPGQSDGTSRRPGDGWTGRRQVEAGDTGQRRPGDGQAEAAKTTIRK